MLYLDTGLMVAALTRECRTGEVQRWLSQQQLDAIAISDWTVAEFSAALSIKVRTHELDPVQRADVLAAFRRIVAESFRVLAVARGDFREAARLADAHASGLRAGDALHLGVASSHGCQLVSLDRVQVKAAISAGVSARLL